MGRKPRPKGVRKTRRFDRKRFYYRDWRDGSGAYQYPKALAENLKDKDEIKQYRIPQVEATLTGPNGRVERRMDRVLYTR